MAKGKCKLVYLDYGNSPKITENGVVNFCDNLTRRGTSYNIQLETLILKGNGTLKLAAG